MGSVEDRPQSNSIGQQVPKAGAGQAIYTTGLLGSSQGERVEKLASESEASNLPQKGHLCPKWASSPYEIQS